MIEEAGPPRLTASNAIASMPTQVAATIAAVSEGLAAGEFDIVDPDRRILLCGIGASHAALVGPAHVLRARGIRADLVTGGELPAGTPPLADVYLAVSQSGRSREVVQALLTVPPGRRAAIVNAPDSPVHEVCGHVLGLGGIVDSSPSTVGFVAALVGLGMAVDRWTGHDLPGSWPTLPELIADVTTQATDRLPPFVDRIRDTSTVDLTAPAPLAGVAEMGSLLLREGPRVPAYGFDTRSYLHGYMDSVGAGAHVVHGGERESRLVDEIAHRGSDVLFVTSTEHRPAAAQTLVLPDAGDTVQQAVLHAVVVQVLAALLSRARGVDIDARAFGPQDTKITASAAVTG